MKGINGALEASPGKPRLLSVKSDVKSDFNKKFKANDTSAAEAPSDDDISIKATKDEHDHKAGRDWSAVDDAIGTDNGGNKEKNASRADDEDDGMEEYSYLTGEIVMKDQDYISALTGDEATPVQMIANERRRGTNGNDAATASAVVVGAKLPSSRATSPNAKCKKEKEVSFDAKFSPKKTPAKEHTGGACELEIIDEKEDNNANHEEFLTARSFEQPEEGHHSEEEELELLSQPSREQNDDELTDVDLEQTQPISAEALARHNEPCESQSLSGVEEGEEHDDDSTTTTGPESHQKMPSQVEITNAKYSPEQSDLVQSQRSANDPTPKSQDQSDDEAYNASTQIFVAPMPNCDESDEDVYIAETQFVGAVTTLNNAPDEQSESLDAKVEKNSAEPKGETNAQSAKYMVHEESCDNNLGSDEDVAASSKTPVFKEDDLKFPAQQSPRKHSDPSPPKRSAYESAGLLGEPLMTGSVGGANLGLAMFQGGTDRDLLTSIALQSTPNLPEAAMSHKSSEETTVVNDKGTKDSANNSENRKNPKAEESVHASDHNNNTIAENDTKDIPSEVFVETPVRERRSNRGTTRTSSTTSRERSKRARRAVSTPAADASPHIRIMFTGVDITTKYRKVCI
jgi:hypothetical protein